MTPGYYLAPAIGHCKFCAGRKIVGTEHVCSAEGLRAVVLTRERCVQVAEMEPGDEKTRDLIARRIRSGE